MHKSFQKVIYVILWRKKGEGNENNLELTVYPKETEKNLINVLYKYTVTSSGGRWNYPQNVAKSRGCFEEMDSEQKQQFPNFKKELKMS